MKKENLLMFLFMQTHLQLYRRFHLSLYTGASGGGEDKKLKKNVEYLLCYTKNRNSFERFNDVWDSTDLFKYIKDYKSEGKSWKYTRVLKSFGEKSFHKDIKDGSGELIKIFKHENIEVKTIKELSIQENLSEKDTYIKYFNTIVGSSKICGGNHDKSRSQI